MVSADETFRVRDLRQKQWFIVDDAYLNGFARLLGPYASMVYFTLCRHADSRQLCFPSISLIAQKVGISERQVIRCIQKLQDYNIIRIEKRPRHNANVYHLLDKTQWIRAAATSDSQSLVTPSHPKETTRRKHKKETTTGGEVVVLPLRQNETEKDTEPDQFGEVRHHLAEHPGLVKIYGAEMVLRSLKIARHNDPGRDLTAQSGAGAYLRGICKLGAVLPRELLSKQSQPPEDPRREEIRAMLTPGAEVSVEGNLCTVGVDGGAEVNRAAIPHEMLIDMVLAGAACVVNAKEKEETRHAN